MAYAKCTKLQVVMCKGINTEISTVSVNVLEYEIIYEV